MQEVSYKNIDPALVDIKMPGSDYSRLAKFKSIDLTHLTSPKKSNSFRRYFWLGFCIIVFAVSISSLALYLGYRSLTITAQEKGEKIAFNFLISKRSFDDLEPEKAEQPLLENKATLESFDDFLNKTKLAVLVGGISGIFPALKDMLELLRQIYELNALFIDLSKNIKDLQYNSFTYFEKNGPMLLRGLSDLQSNINKMIEKAENVQNTASRLKALSPFFGKIDKMLSDNYLKNVSEFQLWNQALESLVSILDTKIDKHFVLIFNNPSEIRPGGGFIGSYGDLVINNGQMSKLEVQDIYWPDHPMNFSLKVVPPEPLQVITTDWAARDANWFFDFPTSARTVADFLESSKIYKEKNITFEGSLALNTNVFASILETVGPIPIEEYSMIISKDNFLQEIQREVEVGKDKKAGGNPKRILGVIMPSIIERLGNLDTKARKTLLDKMLSHIQKKDIMIYTKDVKIAGVLNSFGIDGAVYALPNDFFGNYLAVVNANVAGGKSDAFIKQEIDARIDIAAFGGSFVDLKIQRTHLGKNESDFWYRADNQNYIQIFANPNAQLLSIDGNNKKKRQASIDYEKSGYSRNKTLKEIEDTSLFLTNFDTWVMNAFGKSVFATWFTVPAGAVKTLGIRYEAPSYFNFDIADSEPYIFIFEKQSGVDTKLKITFSSPFGYVFQETDNSIFVFEKDEPLARERIELHLKKK